MATLQQRPWLLNQPFPLDAGYPAEIVRAQHFDATSGGNGVSSPTALKVEAQPAPDGTVRIAPGGGTAVSNYAGVENQSYQSTNFQPFTLPVPPTGSSAGGRHDLLIQRVLDPQYEDHPEHAGEIPPEVAAGLNFWWFELIEGVAADAEFPFPFVPLAHIRRPANTTIVLPEHITDLRELANAKTQMHMFAHNLLQAEAQAVHSGSVIWPSAGTHQIRIPKWADRMQIQATWGTVRSHDVYGDSGAVANGTVQVFFVLGSEEQGTQLSRWNTSGEQDTERFNIVLSDNLPVRSSMKGKTVEVQFRGKKTTGPNVTADGASSLSLIVFFSQSVA